MPHTTVITWDKLEPWYKEAAGRISLKDAAFFSGIFSIDSRDLDNLDRTVALIEREVLATCGRPAKTVWVEHFGKKTGGVRIEFQNKADAALFKLARL